MIGIRRCNRVDREPLALLAADASSRVRASLHWNRPPKGRSSLTLADKTNIQQNVYPGAPPDDVQDFMQNRASNNHGVGGLEALLSPRLLRLCDWL